MKTLIIPFLHTYPYNTISGTISYRIITIIHHIYSYSSQNFLQIIMKFMHEDHDFQADKF